MKKIKLFSVEKQEVIDGENAELYCNLYFVLNKTYGFTFSIESPDLACSDRHLIRLIKNWLMLVEEDYVEYLRRYEKQMNRETHKRKGERMIDDFSLGFKQGQEHGKQIILEKIEDIKEEISGVSLTPFTSAEYMKNRAIKIIDNHISGKE